MTVRWTKTTFGVHRTQLAFEGLKQLANGSRNTSDLSKIQLQHLVSDELTWIGIINNQPVRRPRGIATL